MASDFDNIKKIVDLFTFYYKSVNKLDHYVFKMSSPRRKMILNFVEEIKKTTDSELQNDFLEQFFDYQFNKYYKRENPYGKGFAIQINWIVSIKSFKEWMLTDKGLQSFKVRKNLKKDVEFQRKFEKENYDSILVDLNPIEENDKKRFYNANMGFSYCQVSTTLFNHKSPLCSGCKNHLKCKKLLSEEFPKIYKKRGYEKIS